MNARAILVIIAIVLIAARSSAFSGVLDPLLRDDVRVATHLRQIDAGALAALVAAFVQGLVGGRAMLSLRGGTADIAGARSRLATAQRIAALLLAVTAVCMGAARYA